MRKSNFWPNVNNPENANNTEKNVNRQQENGRFEKMRPHFQNIDNDDDNNNYDNNYNEHDIKTI